MQKIIERLNNLKEKERNSFIAKMIDWFWIQGQSSYTSSVDINEIYQTIVDSQTDNSTNILEYGKSPVTIEDKIEKDKRNKEEYFHNCLGNYMKKVEGSGIKLALCYL